ncbi:hypothetical protein BH10ACT8_BH10ACT8_05400 [soil metagenome]
MTDAPNTEAAAGRAVPAQTSHVIVCGLNDVALRIVEQLHGAGEQVLVISDGSDARLARIISGLGVQLLIGDARRSATLIEAGLGAADALISVEDHDLHNLEIALLARERAPEIRLVVQLTNAAVGRAVSRLTGPNSVLDAAALAAPSFVEACTSRRSHELTVADEPFRVTERVVQRTGDLRSAFGDLVPIAVAPKDGGDLVVCPGRQPGDRVTVLGSVQEMEAADAALGVRTTVLRLSGARYSGAYEKAATGAGPLPLRLWLRLRTAATDIERAFWLSLLSLAGVGVVSIILLMGNYRGGGNRRMGVVDATYFTVETLTTVGFGDFYFAHQHTWLRLWAIMLMILGATLVTILYARLTDLLITRRWRPPPVAGARPACGATSS